MKAIFAILSEGDEFKLDDAEGLSWCNVGAHGISALGAGYSFSANTQLVDIVLTAGPVPARWEVPLTVEGDPQRLFAGVPFLWAGRGGESCEPSPAAMDLSMHARK